MTQELIESTIRDWVFSNPTRGARDLERLAPRSKVQGASSVEDVADALIRLAGHRQIAATRLW